MTQQAVGRYVPLSLLGQGGMGAVYKAEDTVLGRIVALKVMNAGTAGGEDGVARFAREARSLAALDHPNIVKIHDFVEQGGYLCLVMELVDGIPLDKVIREQHTLTMSAKLQLVADVCRALEYAHSKRIIHRDLKPANILVTRDGSPKIVDFGIAKMLDESSTHASVLMGTIDYMSPEQFQGMPVTGQTDIFAAGVMLYELLTGIAPFRGETTAATMHNIIATPLPTIPETPDIPSHLHEVLGRAVAKSPTDRYATAVEFATGLDGCTKEISSSQLQPPSAIAAPPPQPEPAVHQPIAAAPAPLPQPVVQQPIPAAPAPPIQYAPIPPHPVAAAPIRPARKTGLIVTLMAIAAILLIGCAGAGWYWYNNNGPGQPLQRAVKACDVDSSQCTALGSIYQNGTLAPKDMGKAIAAYTRGCDVHPADCETVGRLYYAGTDVPQDLNRAADFYKHACDGGVLASCDSLGGLYQTGRGVPKDMDQASALYEKACNGDIAQGCASLGYLLQSSVGVKQDLPRALALNTKACNMGSLSGCSGLGWDYEFGLNVPKDAGRAMELFQRSCDGGISGACNNLAYMYSGGGPITDVAKARTLYTQACSLGVQSSCTALNGPRFR